MTPERLAQIEKDAQNPWEDVTGVQPQTHRMLLVEDVRDLVEMARRVTELEAALQRIADADGLTIPGHDTTATYARSVLAGDGVDREALSSERERQGLTDSAGIARTELAGDGGGA